MGKIKNPIQVHWTNNVGGLVGYHAFGNHYWRANAQNILNPRTARQQEARAKFAFTSELIAAFVPAYKVGYKEYAQGRSPRAEFCHQLKLAGAITGNMNDGYTIDYEKVSVAKGVLLPTYSMTCSVLGTQHKVSYTWTDNSGQGDAEASDILCSVLFNSTKKVCMFTETTSSRASEACQLIYPTAWAGDTIYNYVFWRKVNGTTYNADSQLVNFFVAE